MSTKGGTRPGAGRPKGGVSQARRLITAAINKGLAQAGRSMYPGQVSKDDEEAAAVQTGAMIVDDMIREGKGADVMKLWAAVAMKDSDKDSGPKNLLADALQALPAVKDVAEVSQLVDSAPQAASLAGSASHQQCDALENPPESQPFFSPQQTLVLGAGE